MPNLKNSFTKISPTTLNTTCYRLIRQKHDPLSTEGSNQVGGRYNLKGKFGALYTGESQQICESEIKRKTCGLPTKFKYKLSVFKISLKKVLDITDKKVLKTLKIFRTELLNDDLTLTQKLAYFAYHNKYEAIVAPSVTSEGKIIVLFPDNFIKKSFIRKIREKILTIKGL